LTRPVVCHLSDHWDGEAGDRYSRHFGVTFNRREELDAVAGLRDYRHPRMLY
jgi:hypothetical protein